MLLRMGEANGSGLAAVLGGRDLQTGAAQTRRLGLGEGLHSDAPRGRICVPTLLRREGNNKPLRRCLNTSQRYSLRRKRMHFSLRALYFSTYFPRCG